MSHEATATWRGLVGKILREGQNVSQKQRDFDPRDIRTVELIGSQSWWPMSAPLITCPTRKVSPSFAASEAAWIASGSNRLDDLDGNEKRMRPFSDDGVTLAGAYGPKFVDQLGYVVQCLQRDPMSRQAVTTFWRERPGPSKDVPCTILLQWLIRNDHLMCHACMRSSDTWLGVPYDVFAFSMLSAVVAIRLRNAGGFSPKLGMLLLTQGSGHLYALDTKLALQCSASTERGREYAPLNLDEFETDAELINHLRTLARGATLYKSWLKEFRA